MCSSLSGIFFFHWKSCSRCKSTKWFKQKEIWHQNRYLIDISIYMLNFHDRIRVAEICKNGNIEWACLIHFWCVINDFINFLIDWIIACKHSRRPQTDTRFYYFFRCLIDIHIKYHQNTQITMEFCGYVRSELY